MVLKYLYLISINVKYHLWKKNYFQHYFYFNSKNNLNEKKFFIFKYIFNPTITF